MTAWTVQEEQIIDKHLHANRNKLTGLLTNRSWKSIEGKRDRILIALGVRKPPVQRDFHHWTEKERKIIEKYWCIWEKQVIRTTFFPEMTMASVEGQARRLGLTVNRKPKISGQAIVQQLIRERLLLGWSRNDVADRSGYSEAQIAEWERGNNMDGLPKIIDWAQTLGYNLVLVPIRCEDDE